MSSSLFASAGDTSCWTCKATIVYTSDLQDKNSGFNIYPESVVGDKDFE